MLVEILEVNKKVDVFFNNIILGLETQDQFLPLSHMISNSSHLLSENPVNLLEDIL